MDVCRHNTLRRKCETCDALAEVAELRAALEKSVLRELGPCDEIRLAQLEEVQRELLHAKETIRQQDDRWDKRERRGND